MRWETLAIFVAVAAAACDADENGGAARTSQDGSAEDAAGAPSDMGRDVGGADAGGGDFDMAGGDAEPALDQGAASDGAPQDLDLGPGDGALADSALPPEDDQGVAPDGFRRIYPIDAEFTEGGIYDPNGHAFFVGSLATGGVYRIDAATGAQSTLFEPREPGVWWTLGMDVDVVANRLYVCAMDDRRELDEAHDYAGHLWGFDLATGERVVNRALSDAADGGTCTDVAVAEDGTVYINDRQNPRLYRFDVVGTLGMIVEHEALGGRIVGQNALVVLPDQSALLSLIYLPSRLVRISLPDLEVSDVEIDGDFFDGIPALSGADGMTLSGDSLLVAFTSQVNRLRPVTPDWRRAVSTTVDVPVGQTDVVHTPGGDYLLNGQAVRFALGQRTDPFALTLFEEDL